MMSAKYWSFCPGTNVLNPPKAKSFIGHRAGLIPPLGSQLWCWKLLSVCYKDEQLVRLTTGTLRMFYEDMSDWDFSTDFNSA